MAASDARDSLALDITFRDDPRLVLIAPRTPSTRARENLHPADRPIIAIPGHMHMLCDRHVPKRRAMPKHPHSSTKLVGGTATSLTLQFTRQRRPVRLNTKHLAGGKISAPKQPLFKHIVGGRFVSIRPRPQGA
jgi:hypothetical protein